MRKGDKKYAFRPARAPRVSSEVLESQKMNEIKLSGENACLALFKSRPRDIVKVYLNRKAANENPELLRWCAANKRAYKLVETSELEKLTQSVHHEGLCMIAKKKPSRTADEVIAEAAAVQNCLVAVLDNVTNPHNAGAIIRVAAHFGVHAVIALGKESPDISPALSRVAEGGLENIEYVREADPVKCLKVLKEAGFILVGTAQNANKSLFSFSFKRKTALVLGSESKGLSTAAKISCTEFLAIPGTGAVESLNVSCAASALLCERWRQLNNS